MNEGFCPLLVQEVINSGDVSAVKNFFSEFEIAVAIMYLEKNASESKVFYIRQKLKTFGIII